MRIDSIQTKNLFNNYVHVHNGKKVSAASYGTDKTELTDGAKVFSSALKEAMQMMDARTPQQLERINAIAQQIRDNTYSVPGEKVAEKILGID